MTKEEAIDILKNTIVQFGRTNGKTVYAEALQMAIKALKQPERKTGKWIYKNDLKQFFCSECGYPSLTYDDTCIYGMDLPNYCEDCGADMREGQDER